MKIYTKSRDGNSYVAMAIYKKGIVTVKRGSKINRRSTDGFRPKKEVAVLREDDSLFDDKGILKRDISFKNLSSAATFVTGRIANGMIVWKTEDGRYVRFTLQNKEG